MMRVGIFGGTFDPIHVGHLDVVGASAHALRLDRVVLVPANVPPHRSSPRASAAHRFAMAALAVRTRPHVILSDLEMLSDQPSFTSTTLDRLAARGIETRGLFLITGADAFRDIATWRDYPMLLDRCHFVVVSRPQYPVVELRDALPALSGRMIEWREANVELGEPRVLLVDAPTAPVSSTDIRRRVAEAAPIAGLVPDDVAAYIEKHGLYRTEGDGGVFDSFTRSAPRS
jgi:nicotinate-nucleotide adenylyltransferase